MSKREITKEQKKDRGEAPLCACGCGRSKCERAFYVNLPNKGDEGREDSYA